MNQLKRATPGQVLSSLGTNGTNTQKWEWVNAASVYTGGSAAGLVPQRDVLSSGATTTTKYLREDGDWIDLTTPMGNIATNTGNIATNTSDIASNTSAIALKASQADLNTLSNTVNGKASQVDLNTLSNTVNGKVNVFTHNALASQVGTIDGTVTGHTTTLTAHADRLVPTYPTNDATKFLRADEAWHTPTLTGLSDTPSSFDTVGKVMAVTHSTNPSAAIGTPGNNAGWMLAKDLHYNTNTSNTPITLEQQLNALSAAQGTQPYAAPSYSAGLVPAANNSTILQANNGNPPSDWAKTFLSRTGTWRDFSDTSSSNAGFIAATCVGNGDVTNDNYNLLRTLRSTHVPIATLDPTKLATSGTYASTPGALGLLQERFDLIDRVFHHHKMYKFGDGPGDPDNLETSFDSRLNDHASATGWGNQYWPPSGFTSLTEAFSRTSPNLYPHQ